MTPFFHQRRRRPRLPSAVGAAAVSRHHPSNNYPVAFRFRGGGVPSRSTWVSPCLWPEPLDHQERSSFPFQAPYDSLDETVKYAERRLLETLQALLIDAKAERTLNPRAPKEIAFMQPNQAHAASQVGEVGNLTVLMEIYHVLKRTESSLTQIARKEMLHFLSKGGTCGSNKHQVSSCVKEEHAVGMDEDVKKLVREFILDEKKRLSIAAVVGMGGIGKSTLAREIYNHLDILARFDCLAWVEVKSGSAPEETMKQLILQLLISEQEKQMLCEQIHTTELSSQLDTQGMIKKLLQQMLYKLLVGKSYFIVLDNMWEKEHLEFLREAFPEQGKASRLLLTSRTSNILEDAQYIHEVKILDPTKSWQLFLKTVFSSDRDHMKCPRHLEKIGREILKKCNGLPLAIKVVGSQLAEKEQSESVWENFLESIDLSAISAALESSYVNLPPKLKPCFLHLGFFKEGTTIRAEKLVQIWIAGGIVSQEDEGKKQTNEEIGRRNLDELISQYLVQVKDMTRDNRVKNCYMNDNLHRLSVAKAEKDIRFGVLKKDGNYRSSHKARHLAICCSREKFNFSMNQDVHLHSLFFRGGGNFNASPCYWESFELKILDLEGFGLKSLPEMIGTATRLRYLGLRNNFLQELPRSLDDLEKLEVLDIALNFMVEVPDIIGEMDSLRHLYMSDIICKEPLRIDALMHLQTLTYISVDNWIYNLWGLQKMKSLRKLGIEELDETSDMSKLFASLAKLKNLDCLILRGFRFRSIPSLDKLGILRRLTQLKLDGLLTKLPRADNFPPNIAYLTLVNSSLDEDPMPQLARLSNLLDLKLRNAFTGEQMVISHRKKFAKLQVLCIGELWHLRNLQVAEGVMPMLKRLEISSCPYLETLPKKIGLMTNLKELKMVTTKKIAAKIRESGLISKIGDVDIQP